jgi:DNA-binding FadR family transcriptional regulator
MLDPDVLAWMFENEPDLALLESLFELRNIVESAAAALAAIRRTSKDLDAMRDGIERMARYTLATEKGRQGDVDFHMYLLRATDNPYIISLTTGVTAAIKTTIMFKQREHALPRDPVPDHLRVFQFIADRNVERAQREMSMLLKLAFQDIPLSQRPREAAGSRKNTKAPRA